MRKFSQELKPYLLKISDALENTQEEIDLAISILKSTIRQGCNIWVLGNGGSLAIAQHFAQDLIKLRGIRAQAITCPSILTAYTNDETFENVYSMPLKILRSPGDAIVIFSCSGKSRNYENILKENFKPIVSIVGTDGGILKPRSNACVHVQSDNYQVCESAFSIVADLINYGLESEI